MDVDLRGPLYGYTLTVGGCWERFLRGRPYEVGIS
jgi:hypothetical protein